MGQVPKKLVERRQATVHREDAVRHDQRGLVLVAVEEGRRAQHVPRSVMVGLDTRQASRVRQARVSVGIVQGHTHRRGQS